MPSAHALPSHHEYKHLITTAGSSAFHPYVVILGNPDRSHVQVCYYVPSTGWSCGDLEAPSGTMSSSGYGVSVTDHLLSLASIDADQTAICHIILDIGQLVVATGGNAAKL